MKRLKRLRNRLCRVSGTCVIPQSLGMVYGVGAASTVTGVLYLVAAHAAYDDANNAREQNESQFMFRGLTPASRSLNERLDNFIGRDVQFEKSRQ